jgi:hypothetical protein
VRGTERCATRREGKTGKPQRKNKSTRTLHKLDAVNRIIEFARGLPFSNAAKELHSSAQGANTPLSPAKPCIGLGLRATGLLPLCVNATGWPSDLGVEGLELAGRGAGEVPRDVGRRGEEGGACEVGGVN